MILDSSFWTNCLRCNELMKGQSTARWWQDNFLMLQISWGSERPLITPDEGKVKSPWHLHNTLSLLGSSLRPLTKPIISCNMGVHNSNMVTSTLTLSNRGVCHFTFSKVVPTNNIITCGLYHIHHHNYNWCQQYFTWIMISLVTLTTNI